MEDRKTQRKIQKVENKAPRKNVWLFQVTSNR